MSDLLLEIGCEEIPHDLLAEGIKQLGERLRTHLDGARLGAAEVHAYGTPRRLVAIARGIPESQPTVEETVTGPPMKAARDKDGNFTKAAEGFAKKQGVTSADLFEMDTERGPYLAAKKTLTGRPAAQVLTKSLPEVLNAIHWSKAMQWADGQGPFVRPVRWICAVLDGEAVPFEFAGITAGITSHGHRFMAPAAIPVTSVADYRQKIRAAHVLIDPAEREASIRKQLKERSGEAGGTFVPDEGLVTATALKGEWPCAVLGRFDDKYLELPREVLITSMREHQDDFAIENSKRELLPAFVNFADNQAPDMQVIAHGNERVLRARLEDARFFYQEDRKLPLKDLVPRLDTFMFQKQLGSVGDKVRRLTHLATGLAKGLGADPDAAACAAALCKCDLVSNMVYEFPELQGIVGHKYALADGEPEAVAVAIEQHYLPRFAGDDLPTTPEGRALALADKIDTLVGIFGVGLIPSGSQDPYALRRQGLGVMDTLADGPSRVDLNATVNAAATALAPQLTRPATDVADQVLEFLGQRLAYGLERDGLRQDVVAACVGAGLADVYDTRCRAEALNGLTVESGFDDLMTSCKRIMKIIPDGFQAVPVNAARLADGAETALWDAFCAIRDKMDAAHPAADRLDAMAALRPQVDAFFDDVLVMDPDEGVRANRLSMLAAVRDAFGAFADFGRVVVA